jgi:hypothetical protein
MWRRSSKLTRGILAKDVEAFFSCRRSIPTSNRSRKSIPVPGCSSPTSGMGDLTNIQHVYGPFSTPFRYRRLYHRHVHLSKSSAITCLARDTEEIKSHNKNKHGQQPCHYHHQVEWLPYPKIRLESIPHYKPRDVIARQGSTMATDGYGVL